MSYPELLAKLAKLAETEDEIQAMADEAIERCNVALGVYDWSI